jgi:hypothetical protein
MRTPFLCRIGFHRWRLVGFSLFSSGISECLRCHLGKEDFGYAVIYYEAPEAVPSGERTEEKD